MSASRSHTIDALRGMAAISVALFHFNEGRVRDGSFYDNANRWGWLGVPVFFVLSGYCMQRVASREVSGKTFAFAVSLGSTLPTYPVFSWSSYCARCANSLSELTTTSPYLLRSWAGWPLSRSLRVRFRASPRSTGSTGRSSMRSFFISRALSAWSGHVSEFSGRLHSAALRCIRPRQTLFFS